MIFFSMAWRNVWRNRRRSLLTVVAIALGLAFNIFMRGIGDGFHEQMVDNSVRAEIGHIQIHRAGYHDDPGLNKTLPDLDRVTQVIRSLPDLRGYSLRVLGGGLASTADNSSGVEILGVDPAQERTVTSINRSTKATRIATTVGNFDLAAMGGRFAEDWMAGGSFAGQWGGAGLRGELTYTWRGSGSSLQSNALRWTFGSDYAINNKWYVLGEYFYNQGQPAGFTPGQPADPSVLLRYTNQIFTLQHHFISAGARYSITPLLNLQTYAVVEPAGPSVFFMPLATYNLTTDTDLSAGAQLFGSSRSGEFHRVPDLFYLEFTVHF